MEDDTNANCVDQKSTNPNCCNLDANSQLSREAESAVANFAASMETPDLRNWFSSYVYQSPELTSSYCFEDSFPIEGESTTDTGLYVEDSEGEEEDIRTDHASVRSNYPSVLVKKIDVNGCCLAEYSDKLDQQHKVPEYSDSLPSEPPDIRNWFSSYVYESPPLDTAEVGGSLPTTIDNGGTEDDFSQKEKTWISTPIRTSVSFLADTSMQRDAFIKPRELIECGKSESESAPQTKYSLQENGLEDQQQQQPSRSDLPSEPKNLSIPGGISCSAETEAGEIRDVNPAKLLINPRLQDESTLETIQRQEGDKADSPSYHNNSATQIGSPITFTTRVCSDEAPKSEDKASTIDSKTDPGWVLPNIKSRKGNSGSTNKGINQYKLMENGSTCMMKMSANAHEKNAAKKKHERDESVVLPEVDKGMVTSRKPLMEISNMCISSSDLNEIAGKWRCPQKTKPCNGPPLKQLRLEKWIHRA